MLPSMACRLTFMVKPQSKSNIQKDVVDKILETAVSQMISARFIKGEPSSIVVYLHMWKVLSFVQSTGQLYIRAMVY